MKARPVYGINVDRRSSQLTSSHQRFPLKTRICERDELVLTISKARRLFSQWLMLHLPSPYLLRRGYVMQLSSRYHNYFLLIDPRPHQPNLG